MASILNVDKIRANASTTDGLTINSNGVVSHPQKPHVSVQFGGGTTYLSHTAGNEIRFSSVLEGDSGLYDTSTYRFTCPVDGLYLCTIQLLIQSADAMDISLYKNSTKQNIIYVSSERGIGNSYVVVCSANDELYWVTNQSDSFYEAQGNGKYSWAGYTFLG